MKVTLISPGVIHLTADTQYELASAFMRMQEFYESANGLRGKYFTHEQCMDTYAANQTVREFSYTTDWAGFNVPGNVVDKFYKLFKHDLLDKEKAMHDLIQETVAKENGRCGRKYYVIGTHNCLDVSQYVYHEHAHALWYMYPSYKKEALRLVNKLPAKFRSTMEDSLVEDGYDLSVLDDEINAYCSTTDMYQLKDYVMADFKGTFPWPTIYLFQRHFYTFADEVSFPETIG